MAEFVKALSLAELPAGECREAMVSGRPVALFNVDGVVYALSNTCTHRGGPLGQGILDGTTVICPWHAWTYDVRSGCSTVNAQLNVERFDVKVEDGQVLVRVG